MSTILTYPDFQRHNFFRTPEWRWERVLQICDRENAGHCSKRDDTFVKKAKAFYVGWKRANKNSGEQVDLMKLFWDEPGLYYAFDMHNKRTTDPEGALYIQARLLARQSPEEIAKEMKTIPETITWYEALYFNIADAIDARDWITKQVLVPAIMRSNYVRIAPPPSEDDDDATHRAVWARDSEVAQPYLDGTLKMLAYFGGPLMTDLLIHGMRSGMPLRSLDSLADWVDGHWTATIRRRSLQACITFEVTKYQVMQLFEIHARIMELEASDEAKNQKRSATESNISALLDELPWLVGQKGVDHYAGTVVGDYDTGAAELRDHELIRIQAGETIDVSENWPKALPAPKERDANHAKSEIELT